MTPVTEQTKCCATCAISIGNPDRDLLCLRTCAEVYKDHSCDGWQKREESE